MQMCCGAQPVAGDAQPDSSRQDSQACSKNGEDSSWRQEFQSSGGMLLMDGRNSNEIFFEYSLEVSRLLALRSIILPSVKL